MQSRRENPIPLNERFIAFALKVSKVLKWKYSFLFANYAKNKS